MNIEELSKAAETLRSIAPVALRHRGGQCIGPDGKELFGGEPGTGKEIFVAIPMPIKADAQAVRAAVELSASALPALLAVVEAAQCALTMGCLSPKLHVALRALEGEADAEQG